MKAIVYILTVSLFGLTQCNLFDWNDDDQPTVVNQLDLLPPPTQEGKFTFGCLVNDTAWVPRTTVDMVAIYQGGGLSVVGELQERGREQNMRLYVTDTAIATNVALNYIP